MRLTYSIPHLRPLTLAIAMTIGLLALAACGSSDPTVTPIPTTGGGGTSPTQTAVATSTSVPAPTPDSRPGGTINIANRVSQTENLDLQSTGSFVAWRSATHLFDGLLRLDADMALVPALAESWEYSDPTTVTFKLRPGLTFHNGAAVTAEDVKFSLERVALPNDDDSIITAYSGQVSSITGVDVDDPLTATVHTDSPFAPLLGYLALPPLSIYNKEWTEAREPAELKINENGAGPFTVDDWQPGTHFRLKAFEGYWEYPEAPKADFLNIVPIQDSVTRVAALLSGQVDFILLPDNTQKQQIVDSSCCELAKGKVVGSFRGLQFFNIEFPGTDKNIRQAINYAIDRASIVERAAGGFAKPMGTSLIPPTSPYHADPNSYANRDLDKARELMGEAGFPNGGVVLNLGLSATGFEADAYQIVKANLAEVGIDVQITQGERTVIENMVANGELDAGSLSASDVIGDPDVMIRFSSLDSRNHFKDETLAELVERGRTTVGFDARFPIYEELQIKVDDVAPNVMLAAIDDRHAQSKDLMGFQFKPNRQIDLMKYAWVEN